jgi:hypothetical protein
MERLGGVLRPGRGSFHFLEVDTGLETILPWTTEVTDEDD